MKQSKQAMTLPVSLRSCECKCAFWSKTNNFICTKMLPPSPPQGLYRFMPERASILQPYSLVNRYLDNSGILSYFETTSTNKKFLQLLLCSSVSWHALWLFPIFVLSLFIGDFQFVTLISHNYLHRAVVYRYVHNVVKDWMLKLNQKMLWESISLRMRKMLGSWY